MTSIYRDIRPVSQLSAPRDLHFVDELSGRPASMKYCTSSGLEFYYSDRASLDLDVSVLDEIEPILAQIAAEKAATGSSEERAIHQRRCARLQGEGILMCKKLAELRLLSKDYEKANPAALRCLKLSMDLYGSGSLDLLPSYLLLAESCMGLGRAAQADQFISRAELQLTKSADAAPNDMVARLQMLKGKVCLARGETGAALRAFATSILHNALEHGPEHRTCGPGLYNLGKVFAETGQWDAALANFDKCVDVWYKSLLGVQGSVARAVQELAEEEARKQGKAVATAVGASKATDSVTGLPRLGAVEADEACDMLVDIESARIERIGSDHVSVAEVRYTRALVLAARGNFREAVPLLGDAVSMLLRLLGAEHSTTQDAVAFLELFQQRQAS